MSKHTQKNISLSTDVQITKKIPDHLEQINLYHVWDCARGIKYLEVSG